MRNSLLREYGQLVNVKLARVVTTDEPSQFIYKRTKKQNCGCPNQPQTINEVKPNCLKIFKNQVNYNTKLGQSLYYDVFDDFADTFCELCNKKYTIVETRFQRCQRIELIELKPKLTLDLQTQTSTCWLIDPFIQSVVIGDIINLTAFYYMCP
jgi:hypothetical protein